MLRARIIKDGRHSLLIALYPENMRRLLEDKPITLDGAPVGLPEMFVIVYAGRTRQHVISQLLKNYDRPVAQHGDPDQPSDLPVRITAKVGPDRRDALMLGLAAQDIKDMAGGRVFAIDGAEIGLPAFHVTLMSCLASEEPLVVLRRAGGGMPRSGPGTFEIRDHEHQPDSLKARGWRLAEILDANGDLGAISSARAHARSQRAPLKLSRITQ